MVKKIDLSGQFGEPIKRFDLLAVELMLQGIAPERMEKAREAAQKECAKIVYEKIYSKLGDLAKELDIDLSDPYGWPKLSLTLAEMYIEGFRVVDQSPRKPGRPRTRSYELFCEVGGRMKLTGHSVTAVCQHLTKERGGKWYGKNYTSLRAEYYELKAEIDEISSNPKDSDDPEIVRIKEAIKPFR